MSKFDKTEYKAKKVSSIIARLERIRDSYRENAKEKTPEAVNHKGHKLIDVFEASAEAYETVIEKIYK